jgi:two-component sensor histidine kinase
VPAREDVVSKPQDEEGADALAETRVELARVRADLEAANLALVTARLNAVALEAEPLHRVRNVLAVVRSIFSRTIESADTLESAANHFRGRLDTLAQYQLYASPAQGFYLEDMIRDALLAFAAFDDPRIELTGPEVCLIGRHAEGIGLALHELVTNSIKFGMLSPAQKGGHLKLAWTVTDNLLCFEWLETGVTILSSAPMRTGFGRKYIEDALPYQLGAKSSFDFAAGRLLCTMIVPLKNQQSFETREQIRSSGVDAI